ncbi:chemotaxis protein CheX [Candidatus Poribacteria bacterium]|nr:chemotaxis protein CheX [Candidatus Poribacteria bacterium]
MGEMERTLYKSAIRIFEDLAFMLPSEELDDRQSKAPERAIAVVGFHGPFSGKLVVRVCGDLLPILAANMLGEEHPPPVEKQLDALREIANVICGNVLPAIAGAKEIFYLDTPVLIDPRKRSNFNPQGDPVVEVKIGMEGGRAEIALYKDESDRGGKRS